MKISELPLEVKELALLRQKEEKDDDYEKTTQDLADAFCWGQTKEGFDYWNEWDDKKALKPESLIHSFANEIKEEYPEIKTKTDPIVDSVIASFKQRSKIGIEKYGTTLEDNNTDDYLQHLQEELMDAILYIEKEKSLRDRARRKTD
jgi:hypothetical protein